MAQKLTRTRNPAQSFTPLTLWSDQKRADMRSFDIFVHVFDKSARNEVSNLKWAFWIILCLCVERIESHLCSCKTLMGESWSCWALFVLSQTFHLFLIVPLRSLFASIQDYKVLSTLAKLRLSSSVSRLLWKGEEWLECFCWVCPDFHLKTPNKTESPDHMRAEYSVIILVSTNSFKPIIFLFLVLYALKWTSFWGLTTWFMHDYGLT